METGQRVTSVLSFERVESGNAARLVVGEFTLTHRRKAVRRRNFGVPFPPVIARSYSM
jgi:hypothetical protein